jgi:hypothetical protein
MTLVGIMMLNLVQILSIPDDCVNEGDIMRQFPPSTMTLYELLDAKKRQNLFFRSIFIGRRMLVAILFVSMKEYPAIQLHLQILITLSMIRYLLKNPPYESKTLNGIEIANEILIISC